jgi:hypothetical protein
MRYDFFGCVGEDLHVGPARMDAGWRVGGQPARASLTLSGTA